MKNIFKPKLGYTGWVTTILLSLTIILSLTTLLTAQIGRQLNYYNITGQVLDEQGNGVSGVMMSLSGNRFNTVFTDDGGRYSFTFLPGGANYTIRPSKINVLFTPVDRVVFNLRSPQQLDFAAQIIPDPVTGGGGGGPTPTPTVTPKATPTPTPPPTPTPTPTPEPDGKLLNPSFENKGDDWIATGSVSYGRTGATDGITAAKLAPPTAYSPASVFQWVKLTAGATYQVTADIQVQGTARGTLGVKWDNNGDGPTSTSNKLTFTVPAGIKQVGIYFKATGSTSSSSYATVDNFKLERTAN